MVLIFLLYLEDTITPSHTLPLFVGFLIFISLGISQLIPKVQLSWLTFEFRPICLMLEIGNVQRNSFVGTPCWCLLGPCYCLCLFIGLFLLANDLISLIFFLILKLYFHFNTFSFFVQIKKLFLLFIGWLLKLCSYYMDMTLSE